MQCVSGKGEKIEEVKVIKSRVNVHCGGAM